MTEPSIPPDAPTERPKLVRKVALTFVGALGVAAALTILFYSMRSVIEIGGSCASGNTPFEIARPCPKGIPGLMVGSIFGGMFFLAVYAFNAYGPNLTFLAWPALFLSLGWNFLEYGFDPPSGSGIGFGWLISGIVFVVMGGVPLVIGASAWRSTKALRGVAQQAPARLGGTTVGTGEHQAAGWVLQVGALGMGIWLGIELFESATGSVVHIG